MEPHAPQVDFQQYRTLLEVSESICAHRDLKALLQELSKRLRSLAQFEFIGLHLHDPARNVMQTSYLGTGDGESVHGLALPMEDSASARVFWGPLAFHALGTGQVLALDCAPPLLRHRSRRSIGIPPCAQAVRVRLSKLGFETAGSKTSRGLGAGLRAYVAPRKRGFEKAGSRPSPSLGADDAPAFGSASSVWWGYRDRTGDLLIAKNIEGQPEQTLEEPSAGKTDRDASTDSGPV